MNKHAKSATGLLEIYLSFWIVEKRQDKLHRETNVQDKLSWVSCASERALRGNTEVVIKRMSWRSSLRAAWPWALFPPTLALHSRQPRHGPLGNQWMEEGYLGSEKQDSVPGTDLTRGEKEATTPRWQAPKYLIWQHAQRNKMTKNHIVEKENHRR